MVYDLVKRSKASKAPGSFSFILSVFCMILMYNLVGLAPYTFSWTSHMIVNFGLAFTLWLSITMMSAMYSPTSFLAHLVPSGSPAPLAPFLVLIETVSITVRPITLAVRLTANIMTGHIIMTLLSEADSSLISHSTTMMLLLMALVMAYFMFEMAVCLVQAYIFTLLPVLYMDEHTEK
uniref:ATP synthase 6 n=1 Tax=Membranipora villosa TaxID=2857147 RepID=UPI002E79FD5C|nr:ATP synthase 6 [Membranipora villosa]WQB41561.1 ATP synthase 6 [Membranipora villosa]